MPKLNLTPKRALGLFIFITVVLFAQAAWWVAFMARLLDEKVDMAIDLGADLRYVDQVQKEEIARQIMVGMEGVFFLVLVGVGCYLIYRALVKNEELNFHQQNFLMAVTHELKTPLASMRIYLDTLKSDKISEERKMQIIPRLKEDVNRLEKLVENILEAGRFERSGYKLNFEWFNLSELVDESLNKIAGYNLKKELVINKTEFKEDIYYYGDPLALGRALESILENSLKYNDKDKIIIDVSLTNSDKKLIIKIHDNGIGLEKKNLNNIFERFYRVGHEMVRNSSGSGLGLYLCREVIKAHKGNIEARSQGLGEGVEFSINLKVLKNYENNIAG